MEHIEVTRRDLGFTLVFDNVLDDERLGKNEILVYMALCRFANGKSRDCFPSINTIADRARLSVKPTREALRILEQHGYLKREVRTRDNGSQTSNLYFLQNEGVSDNTGGRVSNQDPGRVPDSTRASEEYSSSEENSEKKERGSYEIEPSREPNTTETDSPPSFSKPEEQEEYRIRKLIRENHLKYDEPLVQKMTQFKNKHGIEALEGLICRYIQDGKKPRFFYEDFIPYLYTYKPAPGCYQEFITCPACDVSFKHSLSVCPSCGLSTEDWRNEEEIQQRRELYEKKCELYEKERRKREEAEKPREETRRIIETIVKGVDSERKPDIERKREELQKQAEYLQAQERGAA